MFKTGLNLSERALITHRTPAAQLKFEIKVKAARAWEKVAGFVPVIAQPYGPLTAAAGTREGITIMAMSTAAPTPPGAAAPAAPTPAAPAPAPAVPAVAVPAPAAPAPAAPAAPVQAKSSHGKTALKVTGVLVALSALPQVIVSGTYGLVIAGPLVVIGSLMLYLGRNKKAAAAAAATPAAVAAPSAPAPAATAPTITKRKFWELERNISKNTGRVILSSYAISLVSAAFASFSPVKAGLVALLTFATGLVIHKKAHERSANRLNENERTQNEMRTRELEEARQEEEARLQAAAAAAARPLSEKLQSALDQKDTDWVKLEALTSEFSEVDAAGGNPWPLQGPALDDLADALRTKQTELNRLARRAPLDPTQVKLNETISGLVLIVTDKLG